MSNKPFHQNSEPVKEPYFLNQQSSSNLNLQAKEGVTSTNTFKLTDSRQSIDPVSKQVNLI
jgi:hypothetical protein